MREFAWRRLTAFGLAAALGLGGVAMSRGQDRQNPGATVHGGAVEKTKRYQFEVVCAADGITVYPRAMDGKPLDASKLTASVTFYHPNSPKPWFDRTLRPTAASPGQLSSSLKLGMDLSKVPAKGAKVAIEVAGLPEPEEPKTAFTVAFSAPARAPTPAVITYAKATRDDQAAINAQRVCKISGEGLFAMGGPVKVSRGDKSVFICCQSCLKTIQANPDKFHGPTASADAGKPKADQESKH